MMIYTQPQGWLEVEEPQFQEFLKTCADYVTDSYAGARCYEWRHNRERFAMILGDKIYVDPKLLK